MKRNVSLIVGGMMCKHCAKRVEDALYEVKGVSKVNICLETKEVSFIFKGEDLSVFNNVIEEIGYELLKIEEK